VSYRPWSGHGYPREADGARRRAVTGGHFFMSRSVGAPWDNDASSSVDLHLYRGRTTPVLWRTWLNGNSRTGQLASFLVVG
jgi:hypothetical protein